MERRGCCQVEGAAVAAANYAPGKRWQGWGEREGTGILFSFGPPPPCRIGLRSFGSSSPSSGGRPPGSSEVDPPHLLLSPARW